MIEPSIINEAMAFPIDDIEQAIRQSARKIRSYEAARWTVGIIRRELPPHYEMNTRPEDLNEIALPSWIDPETVNSWAFDTIKRHRDRIDKATDSVIIRKAFEGFTARFNDVFIEEVSNVILWFSGKDILAGMIDWINIKGFESPGAFRAALRDWIIENPERTLELLPEWNNLTLILRD